MRLFVYFDRKLRMRFVAGKVLVTGGASNNKTIAQVISNVFQRKVYAQQDFPHSSALGSAYRAKHGTRKTFYDNKFNDILYSFYDLCIYFFFIGSSTGRSFNEVCSKLVDQFVLIAEPDTTTAQVSLYFFR